MEIKFNVTGTERKKLVTAISEFTGWEPVYKGAPTFAYAVNDCVIDKNGTLTGEVTPELLSALADQGFSAEHADQADATDTISIDLPKDGFTDTALVNLRFMYGYKIKRGSIQIVEKEAEIVRTIFDLYVNQGYGCRRIAQWLREQNVPTMRGGVWNEQRVSAILQNEKYTGNALLQKTYIEDHLTKKQVANRGELPMYYAEATHPAIIDLDTFQRAQSIMETRRSQFESHGDSTSRYPFTGIIRCAKCGKSYKRKVTKGKPTWNCATYLTMGRGACLTKQIPEDTLIKETAATLGLDSFDEAAFKREILAINVPEFNHLVFIFRDGRTVTRIWKDRSRSESWNDEMRQAASDRITPEQRKRCSNQMHEINRKRRERSGQYSESGYSYTAENQSQPHTT